MKTLLGIFVLIGTTFFQNNVHAEDISKADLAAFVEGCKHALSQAKPNWDHKDIEMLCSDPYLQGKKNESATDKARRMRLIKKTNEDKERILNAASQSKDDIKPCFDSILATDPGKDLKDVKMLCVNPYLTPTPNESADDQARRKRLINEAEEKKDKMLSKFLVKPIENVKENASEKASK